MASVRLMPAMSFPRDLIRTIGRLKTTSALAPLSVPAGLIGVFAVLMTIVGGPHHPLTWALWIFFIVWMVAIGGAYILWSIKDPDRLQTENYQLEQQRIKIIGDERNPGKVIEDAPLTSNTAAVVSK
jgi:O-antigen/teichoic acid export membrane protein